MSGATGFARAARICFASILVVCGVLHGGLGGGPSEARAVESSTATSTLSDAVLAERTSSSASASASSASAGPSPVLPPDTSIAAAVGPAPTISTSPARFSATGIVRVFGTKQAGSSIRVTVAGGQGAVCEISADQREQWSCDDLLFPNGPGLEFRATETLADNSAPDPDVARVRIDVLGPPVLDGDGTYLTTGLISGIGYAGSIVTVSVNGTIDANCGAVPVEISTLWSCNVAAPTGTWVVRAQQSNDGIGDGQLSAFSNVQRVSVDKDAPASATITSPGAATRVVQQPLIVTGNGETGGSVDLYVDNQVSCSAVVTGGFWTCTAGSLERGNHVLTAILRDEAGNYSSPSAAIPIVVGPAAASVSPSPGSTPPNTPATPGPGPSPEASQGPSPSPSGDGSDAGAGPGLDSPNGQPPGDGQSDSGSEPPGSPNRWTIPSGFGSTIAATAPSRFAADQFGGTILVGVLFAVLFLLLVAIPVALLTTAFAVRLPRLTGRNRDDRFDGFPVEPVSRATGPALPSAAATTTARATTTTSALPAPAPAATAAAASTTTELPAVAAAATGTRPQAAQRAASATTSARLAAVWMAVAPQALPITAAIALVSAFIVMSGGVTAEPRFLRLFLAVIAAVVVLNLVVVASAVIATMNRGRKTRHSPLTGVGSVPALAAISVRLSPLLVGAAIALAILSRVVPINPAVLGGLVVLPLLQVSRRSVARPAISAGDPERSDFAERKHDIAGRGAERMSPARRSAGRMLRLPAMAAEVSLSLLTIVSVTVTALLAAAILVLWGHGSAGLAGITDGSGMRAGFIQLATAEFLAAVSFAGIGSALVLVLPLPTLPGRELLRWSPAGWSLIVLLVASVAGVLLLSPASIAALAPALGVGLAFAALSLALWGYRRFIAEPVDA